MIDKFREFAPGIHDQQLDSVTVELHMASEFVHKIAVFDNLPWAMTVEPRVSPGISTNCKP
jgi:hypothetical protein